MKNRFQIRLDNILYHQKPPSNTSCNDRLPINRPMIFS
nr:MAG TPA: hypothetical protein [Caudoviricetes sp.]